MAVGGTYMLPCYGTQYVTSAAVTLKEAKREILRDMHVKELIQSNHSER